MMIMSLLDFKSVVLEKNEPVVLKDALKWSLLNWTLDDWRRELDGEELEFRIGVNQPTVEPQWERTTNLLKGDFTSFINRIQNKKDEWLYFDYKHLNSWFRNIEHLRQEINWSSIGFPDIKPDECTIWIGSKGAHTPCHADCYGFNLVYQIYGTKLWLLFPPEENLHPTRIPYEESSIYSKINFFSPNIKEFKDLPINCRKVELKPGDVLFVPHKWWHYVENLETSISINVWLPLPVDNEERLKESIVQYFVKQLTSISNVDLNKKILNPNMEDLILESGPSSFMDTLNSCKKLCQELAANKRLCTNENRTQNKATPQDVPVKIDENITTVPVLSKDGFLTFMHQQISRFGNYDQSNNSPNICGDDNIELLEALTNSDVINLITKVLLKNK